MKRFVVVIALLMMAGPLLAGCTPSEYTKGVDIDENYPRDVLEIYDGAVVFESESRFDKVMLSLGTKDDFEDIVEYYRDYYEYKKISPSVEQEDKDEYHSVFKVEGYEFEIEVSEAEGKYIGDLFEYVIEISAKNLEESSDESADNAASENGKSTEETTDAPAVSATEPPTRKNVLEGETTLTAVASGSWYSVKCSDASGSPKYVDYTIYFADETSGSYHWFDYAAGKKTDSEFTYEVVNGVLVLNIGQDEQVLYDAYYDNNQLHLINQETGEAVYMKNWARESGKTPNLTEFTAYGCWITYHEGYEKPIIMALWKDGSGYMYNWAGDRSSDHLRWEQKDKSISFNVGTTYGEDLELHHRGNVLKVTRGSGETMYFYRATSNVLAGIYEITQTNDGEVGTWKATLNLDGTATHKISGGILTFNYDNSDWYINPLDGMLYAFIFGDYATFYYFYDESDLVLHEPTEGLDYTFSKAQ